MIFENGYPRPNGADDFEDAPVIAGMAVAFGYPTSEPIDMSIFIDPVNGKYRRCIKPKYDTSRDQTVCLWAGMKAQGREDLVSINRVNGKDFFAPGDMGHERRCRGKQAFFWQDWWFWGELKYSAKYKPMEELNQLFCKMRYADPKFIKWYVIANPKWRESLRQYWYEGYINEKGLREGDWRGEKDFCEFVIQKIEGMIGS